MVNLIVNEPLTGLHLFFFDIVIKPYINSHIVHAH